VHFCAKCGSAELSTPAPPASFLHHLSGVALTIFTSLTITLVLVSLVLVILSRIDWTAVTPSLSALVLMLGFLYWTTTLLPGPIRKLGKAAAKQAAKAVRKDKRHE
jgi:hypothetical protein